MKKTRKKKELTKPVKELKVKEEPEKENIDKVGQPKKQSCSSPLRSQNKPVGLTMTTSRRVNFPNVVSLRLPSFV